MFNKKATALVFFFMIFVKLSMFAQQITMPLFFLSNATPHTILTKNKHTEMIASLRQEISTIPKAVLFISSNWATPGIYITASGEPPQLFDFKGQEDSLYQIKYPIIGTPHFAQEILDAIKNPASEADLDRGIDHSSWGIMHLLYPEGGIPIFQLSVNQIMPPISHISLGQKLRFLRNEGVLVICTGSIINNPKMMNIEDVSAAPYTWATDFQNFIKKEIYNTSNNNLVNYKKRGKDAEMSVLKNANLMPLFSALGFKKDNETITVLSEEFEHASVSLFSIMIK